VALSLSSDSACRSRPFFGGTSSRRYVASVARYCAESPLGAPGMSVTLTVPGNVRTLERLSLSRLPCLAGRGCTDAKLVASGCPVNGPSTSTR